MTLTRVDSPTYNETDGLFTAKLELSLPLTRLDLANTLECRVESSALEEPVKSHMQIDLQVIELSGVEHHTVQGSACVFTCEVFGARPAANITWTNSSNVIDPENEMDFAEITTIATEQTDGTFITKSQLQFTATRFENDAVFRCDADNVVLRDNRERPIYKSQTLEVMYPPVVRVSPKEITVNTSDAVLLNCQYIANPASLTSVKWYKSGELVDVSASHRYEGGNPENVALAIKETENGDSGNYTCELENTIGKGVSETEIELDVLYVPVVEVRMEPEGPVKESDGTNVTLYCSIIEANPSTLLKVRWYANSTLLKELPDCNETNEDLCHIDPSKLLLESIGRSFFYNYSCEGYNAAGWGPRSEDKELVVNYEPGHATLKQYPVVAVKKKSVTLTCGVEDRGYPPTER
uniref:Ig-like domain-containing protein n=1 Tax=Megaselia scalaris TaxID=36166 RepID=T1GWL1_MEGSC